MTQTYPKVLMIEDNIGDMRWLIPVLQRRGYGVTVVSSELDARVELERAASGEEQWALVVLDIQLATRGSRDFEKMTKAEIEALPPSKDSGIRLARYARQSLGLDERKLPIVCASIRPDEALARAMAALGIPQLSRDDSDENTSLRHYVEHWLPRGAPRREA